MDLARLIAVSAALWFLTPERHLRAQPVLTEMQAHNDSTLADEDGDHCDWIEVWNAGEAPLNLDGWYLTDRAREPTRWRFPETVVSAGGFFVVFASGKDRARTGRELHTNFALDDDGEYLALVAPDGRTVVSALGNPFPPQVADVSYGGTMDVEEEALVGFGSPARIRVPPGGVPEPEWYSTDLDDRGWRDGGLPAGFDEKERPTYGPLIVTDLSESMRNRSAAVCVRVTFELDEPSAGEGILLRARYDDGLMAYLNGVRVATRNVDGESPTQASGTRDDVKAAAPEDILLSLPAGALVAGRNVLGLLGLNASQADEDLFLDVAVVRLRLRGVATNVRAYFPRPSPGWPNVGPVSAVAPEPELSRESGCFFERFPLLVSSKAPGAIIRYTLDRTEPTESSPVYVTPLDITESAVVKARAFETGRLPSRAVTRLYIAMDPAFAGWSSDLPAFVVQTFGRDRDAIGKESYRPPVSLAVLEPEGSGRVSLHTPHSLVATAGLRWRGAGSLTSVKKSFNLKLYREGGGTLEAPLLGFPPDSDWILHGLAGDNTLLRNHMVYQWTRAIGRTAPRTRYVDLFLGSGPALVPSDYQGLYMLMEKVTVGEKRVAIERLHPSQTEEPEVTGGYILRGKEIPEGMPLIKTPGGVMLEVYYPEEERLRPEQKAYISGYLERFEEALYGPDFADPDRGYAAFIDVESFIDHHILTELPKRPNRPYTEHTWMHKDRSGKLTLGPGWDMDSAFRGSPTGWTYEAAAVYPWYPRLFQDPAFAARHRERRLALRAGVFSPRSLLDSVDAASSGLAEAQERNFGRWPALADRTYGEEVESLRGWLVERVAWLDSTLVPAPRFSLSGGTVPSGTSLHIYGSGGAVYYTTDGSDPRAAGEDLPSPGARIYEGPLRIEANMRVNAREHVGPAWSYAQTATFIVEPLSLVVAEVLARPLPISESPYSVRDFQFMEILNVGAKTVHLGGVRLEGVAAFSFSGGPVDRLEPGGRAVAVARHAAFSLRYPTAGLPIAGEFTGNLGGRIGNLRLVGPLDETLQSFRFDPTWFPETEFGGHSLVIRDPRGAPETWSQAEGWRPSVASGGSPGVWEPGEPLPGGWQRPGDLGQDGRLDVSDAVALLILLFAGSDRVPPCEGATFAVGGNLTLLDLNGDGSLDVKDVVHALDYLFLRGPVPFLGGACVQIEGCPDVCRP